MACGKSRASPRSQLLICPPGSVSKRGPHARGAVPLAKRAAGSKPGQIGAMAQEGFGAARWPAAVKPCGLVESGNWTGVRL